VTPDPDLAAPDGSELRAAALAALAESGVVSLPAHLLLSDVADLGVGVGAGIGAFVPVYVIGVVLACRSRTSPRTPVVAGVVAAGAGAWLGRADLPSALVAIVVGLLVALRAVTLAYRDWREPIHGTIGVGALVLGIEVVVSAGAVPEWRGPLLAIVPLFFVGALGSRVVTVWAADVEGDDVRGSWIRRATAATLVLGAAAGAAALLAVRGGVLERVGAWLSPAGNVVLSVFVAVAVFVMRPILWALDAVGVDPDSVRRALEEWRRRVDLDAAAETVRPGMSWSSRLFGLLVFVGIVWLLSRSLRRVRAGAGAYERVDRRPGGSRGVPLADDAAPEVSRLPFRRGLPSETVRRWYAEALLALRARGMATEPSRTPAEILPEVAAAFPEVATGFGRLTHLYEDVRYGNRRVSGDVVNAVEPEIRDVLSALRRPD
jgi:hypothetical protein